MKKLHSGASVVKNTVMWLRFVEETANAVDVEVKNAGKGYVKSRKYRLNAATVKGITLQEQHNALKELWKLK